jgi:hypothetical protein
MSQDPNVRPRADGADFEELEGVDIHQQYEFQFEEDDE